MWRRQTPTTELTRLTRDTELRRRFLDVDIWLAYVPHHAYFEGATSQLFAAVAGRRSNHTYYDLVVTTYTITHVMYNNKKKLIF